MRRMRNHHLNHHGDRHHRRPKSRGGTTKNGNIVKVTGKYHRAYHLLFGNLLPPEVAKILTDVWIDPDYYMVAIKRKKKQPDARRTRRYCRKCESVILKYLPVINDDD